MHLVLNMYGLWLAQSCATWARESEKTFWMWSSVSRGAFFASANASGPVFEKFSEAPNKHSWLWAFSVVFKPMRYENRRIKRSNVNQKHCDREILRHAWCLASLSVSLRQACFSESSLLRNGFSSPTQIGFGHKLAMFRTKLQRLNVISPN